MLTELHGKGGRVCEPAREGRLHCPLIVRPTSEDVVTGHLAMAFRVLNPRWWVPDLLNAALGHGRFRRQVYRRFCVEPWKNRPPYPREYLPWAEGSTQVDLTMTWENPPTTIFIEAKYASDLATKTIGDQGNHGFPSDQLIRNARVGLLECGWFRKGSLLEQRPRDFVLIVLGPTSGHVLVKKYRDVSRLRSAIPHNKRLTSLPRPPFVGEIDYRAIISILRRQRLWFTRPERAFADDLIAYLELKKVRVGARRSGRQLQFADPTF